VLWDGKRAQVRDLGSTNGSQLNGAPVKQAVLEPDSVITIGRTRIVFRVLAQSTAPAASAGPRVDDATQRHDMGGFWGPAS
ncbi:MAG: FHA domain-containing protein, partial [Leifsonia sp.]